MKTILENQILSPIQVYYQINNSEKLIIEQFDNYNKRTYRNRFIILSQNGPLVISVPLKKGKNSGMLFKDVKISYDKNWISTIDSTIKTCYGSSPFFDFFYEDLISIFKNKYNFIYDLNNDLRNLIFQFLEIETQVSFTKSYLLNYSDEYNDLREHFSPVKDKIIKDNYNTKKYNQVFEEKIGFHPNLSIIDSIFNIGKQTILLL